MLGKPFQKVVMAEVDVDREGEEAEGLELSYELTVRFAEVETRWKLSLTLALPRLTNPNYCVLPGPFPTNRVTLACKCY